MLFQSAIFATHMPDITLYPSPVPRQLSVRGKNRKERLEGLMRSLSKTTDELLLQATQRDVAEFFEHEKSFVLVYHEQIKEATLRADRMTRARKSETADFFGSGSLRVTYL